MMFIIPLSAIIDWKAGRGVAGCAVGRHTQETGGPGHSAGTKDKVHGPSQSGVRKDLLIK